MTIEQMTSQIIFDQMVYMKCTFIAYWESTCYILVVTAKCEKLDPTGQQNGCHRHSAMPGCHCWLFKFEQHHINTICYMTSSVSRQDETKSRAVIGYPSGQDGAILPARDFPPGPARSKIIFDVLSHINPLLTQLDRSRWLDIGFVLFFSCLWTETKTRKKKILCQYPAILTSRLVNTPHIYSFFYAEKNYISR